MLRPILGSTRIQCTIFQCLKISTLLKTNIEGAENPCLQISTVEHLRVREDRIQGPFMLAPASIESETKILGLLPLLTFGLQVRNTLLAPS